MQDSLYSVWRYLPPRLQAALKTLPAATAVQVQEVRLRRDAAVVLSTPRDQWLVGINGRLCRTEDNETLRCTGQELEDCVARLCEYSVHTHEQELRDGYIHTPEGCRAGIAGRAVVEHGRVGAVREITGVCLRVARAHHGCGNAVASLLGESEGGVLLCGEPACGKTAVLRDAARQLSRGIGTHRHRVTVVDERGELALGDELADCEVLAGYPKAVGVLQAVRCLAPDVVFLDELGTEEEVSALLTALQCGVMTVASVHAVSARSVCHRPALRRCLESGGFARVVFLRGREHPGEIERVCSAEEVLYEGDRVVPGGGDGTALRSVCRTAFKTAGQDLDSGGGTVGVFTKPHQLYRRPAVRAFVRSGGTGAVCGAPLSATDCSVADTGADGAAGVAKRGELPRTAGRADKGGYYAVTAYWRRSGTYRYERADSASDLVLSADGTGTAQRP